MKFSDIAVLVRCNFCMHKYPKVELVDTGKFKSFNNDSGYRCPMCGADPFRTQRRLLYAN